MWPVYFVILIILASLIGLIVSIKSGFKGMIEDIETWKEISVIIWCLVVLFLIMVLGGLMVRFVF